MNDDTTPTPPHPTRTPGGTGAGAFCPALWYSGERHRSAQLGDSQQDRGILQRLETVAGVGHDEQVSGAGLPR